MFAINILESAWLLYFCRTVFVSWWRSIFIGRQFVSIWCLVEHSVRTHTETLARLSSPRPAPPLPPAPPTVTQAPPPPPPTKKRKKKDKEKKSTGSWYFFFARMFTISSFSFCVRRLRTLGPPPPPPPGPPPSVLPPFRSLCKVYITMVLFYTILCNLPL